MLGYCEPDELEMTISNPLIDEINDEEYDEKDCIMHHKENVDLIAGNIELAALENTLVSVLSRERILKGFIDKVKDDYDYILIHKIKSYLLTALFNAGSTMSSYYKAMVNHDMPQFAG